MKPLLLLALCLAACRSDSITNFHIEQAQGYRHGLHKGPEVMFVAEAGTARFVPTLLEEFDTEAAMKELAFVDGFYREPGNVGYEAVVAMLLERLRAAGFGEQEGLELRVDERSLGHPAWTPKRGALTLIEKGGESRVLHSFDAPRDRDRCLLPTNSPSGDVRGPVALRAEDLVPGGILVSEGSPGRALAAARAHGASAVVFTDLFDFSVDPTGKKRHLDAIRYSKVPPGTELLCASISPRSFERIRKAAEDGPCELHLEAEVSLREAPLRTVVATIVGSTRPDEVVTMAAHIQEPGANDNATGVAGLLEGVLALQRAIEEGRLERPLRSLAFVWGDEYRASQIFLETTQRRPIAGISVDMIGASKEETGAICLLERSPDPGALTPLLPDVHTPWGAGRVNPENVIPSGLAVILRCALVDVGSEVGGWETSENPWEGGSDHDVFLDAGVPGALLWHFTDFTYHTSLDRLDMVDGEELHRTCAALMSGALGVADARPGDLRRYVESVLAEGEERAGAVELEGAPSEVAQQWVDWTHGARRWLSALCNGEPLPDRYQARH